MIRLAHGDSFLEIDEAVGNFPTWRVSGRTPLHVAPWRNEPTVQDDPDIPPVNKRLAGDFLCMPFGKDDVGGDPPHGKTANCRWDVVQLDPSAARLRLSEPVRGATVTKEVRLTGPVLYQTHIVEGGEGEVTFAHHPMARMAEGGRLSFSPKRATLSDPIPQYDGHGLWALGQMRPDLSLACEDGSTWDMHAYPAGHCVEDFAILAEAKDSALGWTVLMRHAEDDMLVVLKDPKVMPVTMLWISNGARDFSPWNSRHTGVIGIEDGCALGCEGMAAAQAENRLTAMGVPTTHALGGRLVLRPAMISLPRPPGWSEITALEVANGMAVLQDASGETIAVPFDGGFFA